MAKKSAARTGAAKNKKKPATRAAKRPARWAAKRTARKSAAKAKPGVKRAKARPSVKRPKARPTVKRAKPRAATRKASPARDVVVVVGGSDVSQIHKVASELESKGMKVDSVLESTGLITGTSAKRRSALGRVKGVKAVEEVPHIQLPPPGSDIQ